MPRTPLVSIVIPAYQSERTLGETLTSALAQTYERTEIIVCLDGATDRSGAIADAYGDLITVVRQENRGLSQARNTAIEHARGTLIAIVDADDVLLPPYVERAVARWQAVGAGRRFVSVNGYVISRQGILPHRQIIPRPRDDLSRQRMLMLETNIATIFSVFPRQMWEELGGFSSEMTAMEDYDFWARAVLSGWQLHFVREPSALYRLTEGSMSSRDDLMNENNARLRRRLLDGFGDRLSAKERAFLALTVTRDWPGVSKNRAAEALAAGDVTGAARLCREAAEITPSDRGLALKATLMARVPGMGRLYRWREQKRLAETAR